MKRDLDPPFTTLNSVITGKFQSKFRLIFAMILKAKKTKNTMTNIHDVTVANRKKSMFPFPPVEQA